MHNCESDLALEQPTTLQARQLTLSIPVHLQLRPVLSHKGRATCMRY